MLAFMVGYPAQPFERGQLQRAFEDDTAPSAAHPGDGPQHLNPVNADQNGCAQSRRCFQMQPATGARYIFDAARRGAFGQHKAAVDCRRQPRHRTVAQLAEFFGT